MNNAMSGMGGGPSSLTPLNASTFDLINATQAMDFLSQMLDDTILQYDGKSFARYFWFGIVTFIGITAVYNLFWRLNLKMRCTNLLSFLKFSG